MEWHIWIEVTGCGLRQKRVVCCFFDKWCCLGILPRAVRDGCRVSVLSLHFFASPVINLLCLPCSRRWIWAGAGKFCHPTLHAFPLWIGTIASTVSGMRCWYKRTKQREKLHSMVMQGQGGFSRLGIPVEFGQKSDPHLYRRTWPRPETYSQSY